MGETHDSSEKRADSKTQAFDPVAHFRRRTEPHAPAMSPPIRSMASHLRLSPQRKTCKPRSCSSTTFSSRARRSLAHERGGHHRGCRPARRGARGERGARFLRRARTQRIWRKKGEGGGKSGRRNWPGVLLGRAGIAREQRWHETQTQAGLRVPLAACLLLLQLGCGDAAPALRGRAHLPAPRLASLAGGCAAARAGRPCWPRPEFLLRHVGESQGPRRLHGALALVHTRGQLATSPTAPSLCPFAGPALSWMFLLIRSAC